MNEKDQKRGPYLQRALLVLEKISTEQRPLTLIEINETLKFPKATLHRVCTTLVEEQFLIRELGGQRFCPGPRLHNLAVGVFGNESFRAQRHAILLSLSQEIGETCNISVPEGSQMIYFDRVETHWPLRLQLQIGSKVPLHCTASGKLYLSTLHPEQRKNILMNSNLTKYTDNTKTEIPALIEELENIAFEKKSTDVEEFMVGMVAIAVPIISDSGHFYASLSFHAPTMRMNLQKASLNIPRLRIASKALSMIAHQPLIHS